MLRKRHKSYCRRRVNSTHPHYRGIFVLRFIARQLAALAGVPLYSDMSYTAEGQLSSSGVTLLSYLNSSASEFKDAACLPVREEQKFMISGLRRDNISHFVPGVWREQDPRGSEATEVCCSLQAGMRIWNWTYEDYASE